MTWNNTHKKKLSEYINETKLGGGEEKIQIIHDKGKLTARERLELFFDDGQYTELGMFVKSRVSLGDVEKKKYSGDGVIAGFGVVHGKTVYAVAQDSSISGGAGGEAHVRKMCEALEKAIETKCPIVFLCDSGGARIEEGIISLAAYSRLFRLNAQASGLIPQIAAIMGNCAGGSSYSPAMCDFLFMVKKTGQFFITGPKVIKALTGEEISFEELGGVEVQGKYSGQIHRVCENDIECIQDIRELLGYLLLREKDYIDVNCKSDFTKLGREIEEIVPENKKRSYDVREVIIRLCDNAFFYEIQEEFAPNMVVGYARLNGKTVGIAANQPLHMGGAIDCDASDKCARFVRTCDCFNIPILVMVDVPGFYPGLQSEKKGILRHGCKMLYAFAEATVPTVTLIIRKGYGGAYCAMNSKDLGADLVFAWPICEIAVMGSDGAVDIMFGKEISKADNPGHEREKLIAQYEEKYLNPYFAASYGMVDEVIIPEETRNKLINAFAGLEGKLRETQEKKHGNIAL